MRIYENIVPSGNIDIAAILELSKPQIIGKMLSIKKIAKILEESVRVISKKEIPISAVSTPRLAPGDLTLTAYFDTSTWNKKTELGISIEILYNPKYRKYQFLEQEWKFLAFRFRQAIQHELLHRQQYKNRAGYDPLNRIKNPDILPEIEYMNRPDEIEAHAHDIALELIEYVGDINAIRDILRSYSKV
jgi:hypothetical protein